MPDPLDPDSLALQGALAGQHSLQREFGRGARAVVYPAREVPLDRPVAMTVLSPPLATRGQTLCCAIGRQRSA